MFETRQYLIISAVDVSLVDFSQILETAPDTMRYSINGTKTFIKWDEVVPDFLADLTDPEGPYSHAEIMEILAAPEWSASFDLPAQDG